MNLPNKLTLLRVLMIPVCVLLLCMNLYIAGAVVFALACFTDFLDGHIARKKHIVTNFGKFADPVADKLLVLTAMIVLCVQGDLPVWAACVVAARELAVDGLRLVAVEQGVVIAAGWLGKIKTNTQFLCVLYACLARPLGLPTVVSLILAVVMSVMTLWSGVDYFLQGKGVFAGEGKAK